MTSSIPYAIITFVIFKQFQLNLADTFHFFVAEFGYYIHVRKNIPHQLECSLDLLSHCSVPMLDSTVLNTIHYTQYKIKAQNISHCLTI